MNTICYLHSDGFTPNTIHTVFLSPSALCLNLSSCYLIWYLNLVGGATETFPSVTLLNSKIDRRPGCCDTHAGITCLARATGHSGAGQESCKKQHFVSVQSRRMSQKVDGENCSTGYPAAAFLPVAPGAILTQTVIKSFSDIFSFHI